MSRICTLDFLTKCSINPHMNTLEHIHVVRQCIVISAGTELRWDKALGGVERCNFPLLSIISNCHKLIFSQLEKSV